MRETWITNGTLLTQDDSRRVLRADLHLVDGRIDAIVPVTKRKSVRARTAKVIDASGKVIVPGFVQTHIHLCQTLFRNLADDLELLDWLAKRIWPMEAAHTAATLKISALLGIHELLSSGTTCILDMGTVRHTETIFETVKATGIRANVGKCLMDHPDRTPKGLRESTEDALAEAVDLHKRWNGREGDRIRASFAPRFVVSCTEKLLREVARLSHEAGAVIHTHASESRDEIALVKKFSGMDNVDYLDHLGLVSDRLVMAHGVWLSDAEIELLARRSASVTHCPSSNLKLASGIARVPELRRRGVNVGLGADGAPCNNGLDMFGEMRLAALIHKPSGGPRTLRAQEAFDMATRDGARALGWVNKIGSIEPGKRADLVALDLSRPETLAGSDPERLVSALVYAADPRSVVWTMVEGRVLFAHGRVRSIDAAALTRDALRAQRLIAKKIAR